MIEIHNQPRASGKTTKVIKLMEEDNSLYCIIPLNNYRNLYPKHLWKRIITAYDIINHKFKGLNIYKVILDEGFSYRKDMLAEIYYYLGYYKIDVIAYGTVED